MWIFSYWWTSFVSNSQIKNLINILLLKFKTKITKIFKKKKKCMCKLSEPQNQTQNNAKWLSAFFFVFRIWIENKKIILIINSYFSRPKKL